MSSPKLGYYLGGHAWAVKEWIGTFLSQGTTVNELLAAYSQELNTVEGNNTFYGLPEKDLVRRWMDQAQDGFRFDGTRSRPSGTSLFATWTTF